MPSSKWKFIDNEEKIERSIIAEREREEKGTKRQIPQTN